MEELVTMQPLEAASWKSTDVIGELVTALAKAQLEFKPVLKKDTNPAYHAKYSDLSTLIAATQVPLAKNGLVVMQMGRSEFGEDEAKMLTVTTVLAHSSGQWISTDLTLPAIMRDRFDAQSVGSAFSYGRRYSMQAILGIAAENSDDDGNAASGVGSKQAASAVAKTKLAAANKLEPITLVPFKEDTLAITGNSLALLKDEFTEEDRAKVHIKWSGVDKTWLMPLADGNLFASIAEKHKFKVIWK